jgi:hypothetical protein
MTKEPQKNNLLTNNKKNKAMEAKIGIYNSHRLAIEAIEVLANKGYPQDKLKIVGQRDRIVSNLKIISTEPLKNIAMVVGIIFGTFMGTLSGLGYMKLPLAHFIYGTGPMIGALIGIDLGLVAGGAISLVVTLLINKDSFIRYKEHLKKGRFLVFAEGSSEEINKAKTILCGCGTNLEHCLH